MNLSIIDALFILLVSTASLYVFRKLARSFGLVDKPNERKHHDGSIPLIGGVSICFSVVHYLYFNPFFLENNTLFIVSIMVLTLVGAIDDRFDVSFKLRLAVQSLVSIAMIQYSDLVLFDLGNILGFGVVELGMFAIPITVLAVLGAINAFNMVDGIDGLLGGLSLVTFGAFALLSSYTGQYNKLYICLLFMLAITPFMAMNLGVFGKARKVFMGDAGSMMIGFTVVWLLLGASQTEVDRIRPVTCLWLIAIPLYDMLSVIIRRLSEGRSPFKPARDHIHHILQRTALTSKQVLLLICSLATFAACIGLISEIYKLPEYLMFLTFILTFILYHIVLNRLAKSIDKN